MSFKQFDPSDIVAANPTQVTVGLWPGNTGSLTTFFSGSQSGSQSGQFYWDVFNINPSGGTATRVFDVAYGHRLGGGHPTLLQNNNSTLATQVIYSQYRQVLLDPGETQFTFEGGYVSDHIYVINVERTLFKQMVDAGNWMLILSGNSGSFSFIDDSGQTLGTAFGRSGQVFNVVSGSLSGSSGSTIAASGSATKGGFGLFYPSLGIIVLSPDAISQTVGFGSGSYTGSQNGPWAPITTSVGVAQYNHASLLRSVVGGADFQARSAENISSTHFFVTLKPSEFNYSNNPSFFDETTGVLLHTNFIQDPRVYVTTIGLYNDANELLAVAKLSQPTQKAFDKAVNLKVRLDF